MSQLLSILKEKRKRGRPSSRMRQLAWLQFTNPLALSSPQILSEEIGVTYDNAKTLLSRFNKLRGDKRNMLCPECRSSLIVTHDRGLEFCCPKDGFVRQIQVPPSSADAQHEVQSEVWGNGTFIKREELKMIAPHIRSVYSSDKLESFKKKLRNEIEQLAKGYSLDVTTTSRLYRQAFNAATNIFALERGSIRIFKAVLYTLIRNAWDIIHFYQLIYDYLMSGPYCKTKPKRKSKHLTRCLR